MGTVSLGSDGVESRLDKVEAAVNINTTTLGKKLSGLMSSMATSIAQLRIFNRHQEEITDNVFKITDVDNLDEE